MRGATSRPFATPTGSRRGSPAILVRACYVEADRARHSNALLRALPIEIAGTSDPTSTVVDRDRLDRGFRRLPTDQRAIVVLHHYLGWSQPEIAIALEIPIGTVKSRLFYATRALRAAIEADDRATAAEQPA